MGRFGKETVDVVAKRQFQAKGDAAVAAANAARQINKQWVTGVNDASLLRELRFQALARYRIAQK